jgi:hypothetical protein
VSHLVKTQVRLRIFKQFWNQRFEERVPIFLKLFLELFFDYIFVFYDFVFVFEGGWVWGSNPYEGKIFIIIFLGVGGRVGVGGLTRAKPGGCTSLLCK